jgi:hypothetical protein
MLGGRVRAIVRRTATRRWCAGSTGERTKPAMEEYMSVAGQAFILTGELFVLSFVAIYAFWFADKLRRNFFGQP